MEGGTTSRFISVTADAVLTLAFNTANGQDVMLGGGAATIQPGSTTEVVDNCGSEHANTLLSRENTTYQGSVSSAKKGIR